MNWQLRTFLLLAVLAGNAWAADVPAGRIFYAPFDGSLDAAEARGDKRAEADGKTTFAPGRKGQGLVVGDMDGSAGAYYQTAGNIVLERGTVAMWVQPVNWQGDDGLYHNFFSANPGEKGLLMLYKYHSTSWGLTFIVDPDDGPRAKMYCYRSISGWKPGEWHHIACAWTRDEGMALYIDGEPASQIAGTGLTDKPLKPRMRFGTDWQRKGARTVLDEVMIFDRMLAPHEVASLAGKPSQPPPAEEPRDVPGVMLAHAILGHKVLARVYLDCLGDPSADSARLSLTPSGQTKSVAEKTVKLSESLTALELDLKPLPKGVYAAQAAVMSQGTVRAIESLRVSKETDDTWETAACIGKEDKVLPPFAALKLTGNQVECSGPRYEFGDSGLPARLQSRGSEMLAGPIQVLATAGEGAVQFSPEKLKVAEQSDTQAKLSGRLDAASLSIETDALARYDGTVWMTLRFRPKAAAELKRLHVEIPIAADQAKYLAFIAPELIGDKRLGYDAFPAGDGVVWSREFLPSLWLGTEDQGLGWYAESDEHWDIEGDNALTIERRKDATVLRMNIIRQPRRVDKDFTIEFGLQATPVRQLAPDWRSYQGVPNVDITKFFMHLRRRPYPRPEIEGQRPRGKVCYLSNYHQHFSNTLPKDPEECREMFQRAKGFGLLCTPYTDVTLFPENAGDFWMRGGELRFSPGGRACGYGPVCTAGVCHHGPYSDWFVWYVSHLVREYGSNGIYLDEMWPYPCHNAAHGCGYTRPDGSRRVTYPLRATNETYRRIRTMLAATGQPFWMTYHISGGRVPPLPTFGDCLLLAEERNPIVAKNPDYTANTTSAQWLASFATEAWGIPVIMIPQFKMNAEWMKSADLAEKLMAAVVPHDLMVWPVFADTETIMKHRDVLERFGIGQPDARFLAYWQAGTGLRCDDGRIKLSGYLRPEKLLLCVANWSGDEVKGLAVQADWAAMKLPADVVAHDCLTGEAVVVQDTRVVLSVPPKRLRLVEVRAGIRRR